MCRTMGWVREPLALPIPIVWGVVRDAIGEWSFRHFSNQAFIDFSFGLPIVGETWDGMLNDINGYHVKKNTCGRPWIVPMPASLPKEMWEVEREWLVMVLKVGVALHPAPSG